MLNDLKYLDSISGSFENQLETGIEYLKEYPLEVIEKLLPCLSDI